MQACRAPLVGKSEFRLGFAAPDRHAAKSKPELYGSDSLPNVRSSIFEFKEVPN